MRGHRIALLYAYITAVVPAILEVLHAHKEEEEQKEKKKEGGRATA